MLPEPDGTNPLNPSNPPSPANASAPVSVPPSAILRFLLLLKALGRRWLLATSLVLLLAALVGGSVFYFRPPPKQTVCTLLHVPPHKGVIFKNVGAGGGLTNHQRTQLVMLKSRLVLNSALCDPKVAQLSVVREQAEPVEWLEQEIQADFSAAPEVLRITMSGDRPEQLVVLVDAIVQAYRREIVDNEKNQRREHLRMLRELREKYEVQLRTQQKTQREIEENANGRDAAARALVLSFERQHLALAERELLQTQSKLREARIELQLQQEREKKKMPEKAIPDAMMDAEVDKDPAVVKLLLAKQRAAVRQQLLQKPGVQETPDISVLQGRIAGLEGTEKLLIAEVERLRTVVQGLADNGVELNDFRDEISHTENLVKRLVGEEQALNVELEIPSQFKVLEEAQILPPKTTSRMVLMNAGVAVGGFALALLAVGWWDFSRRGRPAQLRAPRAAPLTGP
ncbi:MAG TPA: hypothetical protein VH682_06170 [Gemmataceae bacterium]|jgi:hypothetical protein